MLEGDLSRQVDQLWRSMTTVNPSCFKARFACATPPEKPLRGHLRTFVRGPLQLRALCRQECLRPTR